MPHPVGIAVAVYVAWELGYFDGWGWSTRPPKPEDLDPETLRDVMAKYGDDDPQEKDPFAPRYTDIRTENNNPKRQLNEEVPQWVIDCCEKRKDRQCCDIYQSMTRDFDPLSPPNPSLGNEPMGPLGREKFPKGWVPPGPFNPFGESQIREADYKYKNNRNMKLTRVKYLIKEQIKRLNEQNDGFEPEPQQPSLNPNFINNMESLYARKGCKGLMKKSEFFQTKLDRVSQRTGAGMPAWANQLDLKINHITTMMSQMGCDDDTPTMV